MNTVGDPAWAPDASVRRAPPLPPPPTTTPPSPRWPALLRGGGLVGRRRPGGGDGANLVEEAGLSGVEEEERVWCSLFPGEDSTLCLDHIAPVVILPLSLLLP